MKKKSFNRLSRLIIIAFVGVCALNSGAQTLTATYVELADSADTYIARQQWADAERVIVKALRHEPANKSNFLLWSNLGIVRENQGNTDGAVEAYTIGLASAPKSTVLLTNRARAYLAGGHRSEAQSDLDAALATDSTLQWPRKMRGILRAGSGDRSGALTDLEYYEQKFGKDAIVSEALGDLTAAEGDVNGALAYYREAYKAEPDANLLSKAALTAYAFGRIEEMRDDIAEGIVRFPREGILYLMRAMIDKASYQTSAMESDLKMAKELGVDKTLYDTLTGSGKK